jgi:hypothetical protein
MRIAEASLSITIDTDLLTKQRALIGTLIGNLDCGRTGIAIMSDRTHLIGIQGILDAVADSVNGGEGPDCPGCGSPGNCDDCKYPFDTDFDPVCNQR